MLSKHFLFVVGLPALLVLIIGIASTYQNMVREPHVVAPALTDVGAGQPVVATTTLSTDAVVVSSSSKLAADTFIGTLEEVHTGCFADGECYAMVEGKHVTAIVGRTPGVVGEAKGVDGFGGLEAYIGKKVEVYAQRLAPSTYTLYGSEGFYIEPIAAKALGEKKSGDKAHSSPTTPPHNIRVGEPNPSTPKSGGGCVVGGCSSQLCVEEGSGAGISTCEYRAQYACYKSATCARQSNGQCGWTPSPLLAQCLSAAENTVEKPQVQ